MHCQVCPWYCKSFFIASSFFVCVNSSSLVSGWFPVVCLSTVPQNQPNVVGIPSNFGLLLILWRCIINIVLLNNVLLCSPDPLSNWCAAVALSHCLKGNPTQKEQLLRVQLATSVGEFTDSLFFIR